MNPVSASHEANRSTGRLPFIDGLRAVSILAVVLHHAFEWAFPSGYLGVDVFFVISGFVITRQLVEFRFESPAQFLLSFYRRRICRLLPALIVVTLAGAAAFAALTSRSEGALWTGAWSLVGLGNIYLYVSAQDYFSLDASLNPLTHLWSLGVEEQFYLLYPAVLLALGLPRDRARLSRLKRVLLLIIGGSLLAYMVFAFYDPIAAFYLTPFRLWELTLGALAYVTAQDARPSRYRAIAQTLAFICVVVLLLFPTRMALFTPLVCAAAAALLWATRTGDSVARLLSNRLMTHIGSISYSLYLWHWPILVIGRNVLGEGAEAHGCLLILTYLVSLASSRYIEERFRRPAHPAQIAGTALKFDVVALSVIAGLLLFGHNVSLPRLFGIPEPQMASVECHGDSLKSNRDALHDCLEPRRSAAKPRTIFLLGDSHAAHFYWMVKGAIAGTGYELRFVNSGALEDFPRGFLSGKRNAESRSLDYALSRAERGDLVALAFFRGHLNEDRGKHIPLMEAVEPNAATASFVANMDLIVERFASRGVAIVLLRDTPMMSKVGAAPTCALQVKLFGASRCRIDRAQDAHTRWRQDFAFDYLGKSHSNVRVFDPAPFIFGARDSLDVVDSQGEYLMVDWNHISKLESERLALPFRRFLAASGLDGGESPVDQSLAEQTGQEE